jgi:hypothetical protein
MKSSTKQNILYKQFIIFSLLISFNLLFLRMVITKYHFFINNNLKSKYNLVFYKRK